jgi:hypothetical protein
VLRDVAFAPVAFADGFTDALVDAGPLRDAGALADGRAGVLVDPSGDMLAPGVSTGTTVSAVSAGLEVSAESARLAGAVASVVSVVSSRLASSAVGADPSAANAGCFSSTCGNWRVGGVASQSSSASVNIAG